MTNKRAHTRLNTHGLSFFISRLMFQLKAHSQDSDFYIKSNN